jgi:hypothetical protein
VCPPEAVTPKWMTGCEAVLLAVVIGLDVGCTGTQGVFGVILIARNTIARDVYR